MLKQTVCSLVLTLMLVSTSFAVHAGFVLVTNNADSGPGSLENAVETVNGSLGTINQIFFNPGLQINLTTNLPAFNVAPETPILIIGASKLNITASSPADLIFNAGTSVLHFVGNDDTGASNWGGNILSNATLMIFEQQTSCIYSGILSGSTALDYAGGGQRLTLRNASVYTGGSNIHGTTVRVEFNNALPVVGTVNIIGNGILEIADGFSQTLEGITGDGSIQTGTASILNINSDNDFTFEGTISGAGKFVKEGTGVCSLTNSSQYTGGTDISEGTIKVDTPNASALPTTGPVSILGVLEIANGSNQTLETISGTGNIIVDNASTLRVNSNADNLFAGSITTLGTGVFIKEGINILALSNVNAGQLQLTVGRIDMPAGGSWNGLVSIGAATLGLSGGAVTGQITGNGLPSSIQISDVFSSAAAITDVGTIQVNSGGNFLVQNPVTGYSSLAVLEGGIVQLNNGGSLSSGINLNKGTFAFNGGSYQGDVIGVIGSTMNVNATLAPPGDIIVGTLNINPQGTFILSNDLSGVGTVVNAGTLVHTALDIRTIGGNFIQESTGIMDIGISSLQQYSQLQVNGNTLLNGGIIHVQLSPNNSITDGEVFDIITSTGGITNMRLPGVSQASLSFGFIPVVSANKLQLVVKRQSYKLINTIPALEGIATGLENLRASNSGLPLFGFVDRITSHAEFEQLLEQLAPVGLNGLYTATGFDATDRILLRLDTLREQHTGYAAGDMTEDRGTVGPILFGNAARQGIRAQLHGYDVLSSGFGFVWDYPIVDYCRFGLGATYAHSSVKQLNNTVSHVGIGNFQGLMYLSTTYDCCFVDAVLGAGFNRYHGKRNIVLLSASTVSDYNGFQYSAKVKTGVTLPCHSFEFSPILAYQYLCLHINAYQEKGVSWLSLSNNATYITAGRVSVGGRIANRAYEEWFFPEIHMYYIWDVHNPGMLITSQFVAGGGAFDSKGVQAAKSGVNVGASITRLMSENFLFNACYDFDSKPSFKSHALSLKLKYLF